MLESEVSEKRAKHLGYMVVLASWLAVFCLFGYRATFSVLQGPMAKNLGWSASRLTLGYSLMMSVYAVTAFFSGMIIDKWGTKPAYFLGAISGSLGFLITSFAKTYISYLLPYAVFAGIGTGMLWVSSTVSVRKWYVGKAYATMWGMAFMGAPVAQVILSLGAKQVLATMDWRFAMRILSLVVFIALIIATIVAKKNPEYYGLSPFGLDTIKPREVSSNNREWSIKQAFSTFPIWGAIIAFLTSMVAEFLVWTQIVKYWTSDCNLSLSTATNLYVVIGIAGIFTMPFMGFIADKLVSKLKNETKARKLMITFAPITGVIACIVLMTGKGAAILSIVSCIIFAVYWAIEPGGVAGYAASVYGNKTFGKIWGLSTLIVMGIGPAFGSFMGAYLYDISGNYFNSLKFATASFLVSAIVALFLPLSIGKNKEALDK
ncbi:MFS transporter [Tepidibacter formicigenes]|uniref:Sugar phosphate permease n=1 Tax=Tepidibacter formicigenes DSM 15518 TaxID=1123349 RepID=A0A1M6JR29_9FIRM|nr:MFS transporter [Tepidibacter formicigenes]SHJ49161.1 Sugar phosphate permease [Tepidibacter formicigenes DSM 15518]